MKINADKATTHIAKVLKELEEAALRSNIKNNDTNDLWWKARVIVGSLIDLGVDVEYEDET
jgi:hypothetical protein